MLMMVVHFPAFVEEYNDIRQFSHQSENLNYTHDHYWAGKVKKNNDEAKQCYFQNNNRQDAATDVLSCDIKQYYVERIIEIEEIISKQY